MLDVPIHSDWEIPPAISPTMSHPFTSPFPQGLTIPDLWQQEAVRALRERRGGRAGASFERAFAATPLLEGWAKAAAGA